MNDLSIIDKPLPKLHKNQLGLYVLFCNAVKDNRVLSGDELFAFYKNNVASGESDYPVHGSQLWQPLPWREWEWKRNFESWFIYSLGSLLKKGYLRVVPAIDLSQLSANKALHSDQPAHASCQRQGV